MLIISSQLNQMFFLVNTQMYTRDLIHIEGEREVSLNGSSRYYVSLVIQDPFR